MEKRYPLLLPFLAILVIATSCQRAPRLVQHPHGIIPDQTFLDFAFSADMVEKAEVEKWSDEAILSFEPALEGMFTWKDRRTLRFQSRATLPKATTFTVTATDALPKIPAGNFPVVTFETEPFRPINAAVSWRNESFYSSNASPVQADLGFNMEVEPDSLKKKMDIYINGIKAPDYSTYSWSATSTHSIVIDLEQAVSGPVNFRFVIKAGLVPSIGRSPLKQDTTILATLMPIKELKINDVVAEGESGSKAVRVSFNQPVDIKDFAANFKVVPEVPVMFEQSGSTITVNGSFKGGKTYGLRLAKGLKGMGGGTLDANWGSSVVMPSMRPFARFTDYDGMYMLRNGLENFRISSSNLGEFIVNVYEIYENNLVHFLDDNYSLGHESYYSDEDSYFHGYGYGADIRDWGRKIYSDTIEVQESAEGDVSTSVVHLKKKLRSKYKGIFAVEIQKPDEYYAEDAKIISLSDIGLVARKHGKEMLVFVNSLSTAMPLPGAQVNLISETNQTMFTVTADGAGVARFPNVEALGPGFDVRLVYVNNGSDYNFLDLERSRVDAYRFELGGKSHREWDAFAWSDRNLYRPGDTAHIACLLRDWNFQTQDGMPVLAKLHGPTGEEGEMLKFTTQKGGAVSFDLPFSMGSRTGSYALDFYTATETHLTTLGFHVEDFLPDKIKVTPRAQQPEYHRGDTAQLIVDAEYYFGAPCDSHICEIKVDMALGAYQSKHYKEYQFHSPHGEGPSTFEYVGHLHADGRDTIGMPISENWRYFGPIYANGYATVHDNTGRTVTRKTPFTIHTHDTYIGLRKANEYYLSTGDAAEMDIVAVNPQTDLAADSFPVIIQVNKQIWHNSLRHTSERYVMESEDIGSAVYTDTILQRGKPLHFAYRLKDPGVYRIKVSRPGEKAEHIVEYLVYGKGAEYASSFGTDREGTVHITPDKKEYKVGETARIHFATPFAGRMLVTFERDRVMRHMYVDVPRTSTEIRVPVTEEMVPNVVVSTTLFHPMRGRSPLPFTVSHGYLSLKVDNAAHDLPLKIKLPERAYPGQRTYATVLTAPNASLIVSAVDEGILAIKSFRTPDPYPYFYEAREHRVEAYDLYQFLLPEIMKKSPATGGDMSGGYSGLNPFQVRRFRPVALWSGIVKANGAGVARVPLDVHAGFNGKVRVMAVAWQGRRFGSGDAYLKVHDDLVVQAGIPRLITSGDSVHVPVHVMNTTDKVLEGILKMELEGPLKVVGAMEMPVKVLAHDTYKTGFAIRTANTLGKATIRLRLLQGKRSTVQETHLAVRAAGHLEKTGGHGRLDAGQQKQIIFPAGFHPETQNFQLRASNFPAMEHSNHFRDLLLYPHGCTEQIVSKLFPQLYFNDLAEMVAPEAFEGSNPVKNIQEGIKVILERQAYNGGFGYWSPESDSDWLTVYTVHFLLEARKAGFPVREDAISRGLERVHSIAQTDGLLEYRYSWGAEPKTSQVAPKERVYALFVCSLAGNPEIALLNYFKSHPAELSEDGRFLIAAAFALANDPASFQAMLPKTWHPETTERLHNGNLDSELRPSAIMLNALLTADPGHPFVPSIVEYLARNADKAFSTQDKAWLFLGLGKAAKGQAPGNLKMELVHQGKVVQSADGKGFKYIDPKLAGETVTLRVTGQGKAYYAWEAEGVPLGANRKPRRLENGLHLKREYFTTEGAKIVKPYFLQGELIVCKVKLTAERDLDNLAITDLIAAGMEVENERLSSTDYPWITTTTNTLAAQDVRDGGIVTYASVRKGESAYFNYLLRPVNPGRYQVPPIVVDAMYDTRLYGFDQGFEAWVYPANTPLPVRTLPQKAIASNDSPSLRSWWQSNLEKARRL